MIQTAHRRPVVFLGPQRREPAVRGALEELLAPDESRPIAAITAGWEERESEVDELTQHVARPVVNLALHQRAVQSFEQDPELLSGLQAMHDELTEQQRLYRMQLRHLSAAARDLLERTGSEELLADHQVTAFENLRNLDDRHSGRVAEVRERTAARLDLDNRPSLAHHRGEIADAVGNASALCIAGGHVGILYNRLWLFGVMNQLPADLPIVAWSAGSMVLASRIVLFHDTPPEGDGHAELLGPGFGVFPGVVPFPHARHRLRLGDEDRVQLISRRFPDSVCLAFDDGCRAAWDGEKLTVGATTRQLIEDGTVVAGGV